MVGRTGCISRQKAALGGLVVTLIAVLLRGSCSWWNPAIFNWSGCCAVFKRTRAPMEAEVVPGAKTTLICEGSMVLCAMLAGTWVHFESVGSMVTPICEVALVAARKMS